MIGYWLLTSSPKVMFQYLVRYCFSCNWFSEGICMLGIFLCLLFLTTIHDASPTELANDSTETHLLNYYLRSKLFKSKLIYIRFKKNYLCRSMVGKRRWEDGLHTLLLDEEIKRIASIVTTNWGQDGNWFDAVQLEESDHEIISKSDNLKMIFYLFS